MIKEEEIDAKVKAALNLESALNHRIAVEVHLVFEHQRFHPNPVIRIYGMPLNRPDEKPQPLKDVEVWDWFQENLVENQYTY